MSAHRTTAHLTGDPVVYADGLETGSQARQPRLSLLTQAHARSCSAQNSLYCDDPGTRAQLLGPNLLLFKLNYICLCYYNYSLIISSYHNDARRPSAQISRYHNDTGTRARLLGLTCAMFFISLICFK